MTGAVDVNIFIYARDGTSPFHKKAVDFLNHLFESGDTLCITWDIVHAFLRLSTSPAVCSHTLAPESAWADIDGIIHHPSTRLLTANNDSWVILARLMKELHLRGPVISDAVTASILEANGVRTLYTNDRDFWKFPALKPINPIK
jgi:toxin-antitoxin system PIN domain toxin